jgi:mRNA interferase HigB
MNVYNKGTLNAYSKKHPAYKKRLGTWHNDVSEHKWKNSADVKRSFARASILNSNRVVFDIGTNCRIVTEINYLKGWLFIKFIGSHRDYDNIDAATVDMFRNKPRV